VEWIGLVLLVAALAAIGIGFLLDSYDRRSLGL